MRIKIHKLWNAQGWQSDQIITLNDDGIIVDRSSDNPAFDMNWDEWVIPGFQNAHSHAFQYAMAGLAEHLPPGAKDDDFWSWRQKMYQLALSLSPDDLEAIATLLYAMMIQHGITHVCEFHYLHHDCDGQPFSNLSEMSDRLVAAAENTGMGLTLLPIFYQKGGFGRPALTEQRRFISASADAYQNLWQACRKSTAACLHAQVGLGIHSLRAVEERAIPEALKIDPSCPVHIHIAEQQQEVRDCIDHWGKRPVQWLLTNTEVNRRFHLVHATHMQPEETRALAQSGATAVVCPATEGNLGDGFFDIGEFRQQGGKIAIGTDSHISLSPLEDLRWMDYGSRMRLEKRNVMCQAPGQDSGMLLLNNSWQAGRAAAGFEEQPPFAVGSRFEAIKIDRQHPTLLGKPDDQIISALIYSGDLTVFKEVWLGRENRKEDLYGLPMLGYKKRYQEVLEKTWQK